MSDEPDRDALAAEYVLGSLEGDEQREAERLLAEDPAFARSVTTWQQRLAPLASTVAPIAPPGDLWTRIEATIAPASAPAAEVVPFRRRARFWQGTTVAALAIAAGLAAFIVLRQPATQRVALLAPLSGGAPVLMVTADAGGAVAVRPVEATLPVASDKDLELWSLAKGETRPRSLGVLPASGRHLTAQLANNSQLLVSLEPKGGSPTGQPTGPVLYGGWLTTVDLPRG
jgi:anti-sigma-K factor RskA